MKEQIEIKVATTIDLEGILKLQSENQIAQGGTLSGELTLNQIKILIFKHR